MRGAGGYTTQPIRSKEFSLRLYNVIVVFDVYCIGEENMPSLEAVQAAISSGMLKASTGNSLEVREVRQVREAWLEQSPIVADDVSDQDFKSIQGKTTKQVAEMLLTKQK